MRLGLEQSPAEIIAPIIDSASGKPCIATSIAWCACKSLTAIDAGMGWRFAAVTLRDVGRLKQDPHRTQRGDRNVRIKQYVLSEARRSLGRERLRAASFEPDYAPANAGASRSPRNARGGARPGGGA